MLYQAIQLFDQLILSKLVKICMLLTNINITSDILTGQQIRIFDSVQYKPSTLLKSVVVLVAISLLLTESVIILNWLDGLFSSQSSILDIVGSPYFLKF